MGKLTTHILDTAQGRPGKGIILRLYKCGKGKDTLIGRFKTNSDGRCDKPLLADATFKKGRYRLEFDIAAYYKSAGIKFAAVPFLDVIAINFGIADEKAHYHVPLLVSPYGYSTYRGS